MYTYNDLIPAITKARNLVTDKHSFEKMGVYSGKLGTVFNKETETDLKTGNFAAFRYYVSPLHPTEVYFKRCDGNDLGVNSEPIGTFVSGFVLATHGFPASGLVELPPEAIDVTNQVLLGFSLK